ncbi:MAG: ABC transporter ATP-binding protein [Firmicutes bacterium]|nr:ABC transporter ATP-binding protein [Bacillota bacterium]
MSDTVLKFENVSKEFRFYRSNHQRLMKEVVGLDVGEKVKVFEDISFEIKRGENVAIIGNHASGKSTLMRMMAGIILPSGGKIECAVKDPMCIFDQKLGFDMGISGRDNIKMKAAILGWSKREEAEYEDEIIKFAEMEDIIDFPLRSYQSGAISRLGLTINTQVKPELLIYDAPFNFGGPSYLSKCVDRLKQITLEEDTTTVFTAANVPVTKELCQRGIVIDEGKIVYDSELMDALKYFRLNCKPNVEAELAAKARRKPADVQVEDDSDDDDF